MKIIKKNSILIFFSILLLFSIVSCSKKVNFLTSPVVPAARGYVKVSNDKNKNYVVQIHLQDLAEVQRLQPSKQTYIVWMITDHDISKNIGQIKSSASHMSRQLKANFETVSSVKPTKIFITAEDDPSVQFPGTQVVLSTDNF
ncbi:hypothetical protein [Runella sp.]|uniref:hypothetical protein n=1 Tax=Runella sp. TaxID=1960881 RepID=UPI003D0E880C